MRNWWKKRLKNGILVVGTFNECDAGGGTFNEWDTGGRNVQ